MVNKRYSISTFAFNEAKLLMAILDPVFKINLNAITFKKFIYMTFIKDYCWLCS